MELPARIYSFFVRPEWFNNALFSHILKSKVDLINKNILDFGCGTGAITQFFLPEKYVGVDCSEDRIIYARKMHPRYTFKILDKQRLPVQDGCMDYVLVFSVLHHIPTYEIPVYINEFKRILVPEGKVIVIEPCFFKYKNINNAFMRIMDRGKYIRNENEYVELFTSNGFDVDILDRYRQLFLYNKLFFTADPV